MSDVLYHFLFKKKIISRFFPSMEFFPIYSEKKLTSITRLLTLSYIKSEFSFKGEYQSLKVFF